MAKVVSTGITALDKALMNGLPKGFTVLVTGPPGSGTELIAKQFAGASVRDENVVYFTTTERDELSANPPAAEGPPVTARRVLHVLGDPQILRITASYFIMNYVFYLVTFWSFLYLVQERRMTAIESGWLASLPFVVAGAAAAAGGRLADHLRARYGDRIGMRVLPLIALPTSALLLYLTVSATSPYWAVAALCFGFGCVEITEGSFWGATMRLAPQDTMAATAVLNTGGNLGGVVATPIIAVLSAHHGWTAVFATGAVLSMVAAALWFTIDASPSTAPVTA